MAKVKANQIKYFGVPQGMLGSSTLRNIAVVLKGLKIFQSPLMIKAWKILGESEGPRE
jgi:hypothetical protein